MQVVRPQRGEARSPEKREHFSGPVQMHYLVRPEQPGGVELIGVYFPAGARTVPHVHSTDQALYILEGEGIVATESERLEQTAEKAYGNPGAAKPSSYEGKGASTVSSEHNNLAVDSMGVCTWPYANFVFHTIDRSVRMLQLATGKDWDVAHVLKIAERLRNLERMFDVRQGMNREADTLPKKFFEKPLSKGKYEGAVLDKAKFEGMKDEYYALRGWDPKTGIPTSEKLAELGLSAVVEKSG